MDHPERSDYVFQLAEEVGLPIARDELEVVEDNIYREFCTRYHTWSMRRDEALARYLCQNPSRFRCFIPRTERAFELAGQTLWYLDEIILSDPFRHTGKLEGDSDIEVSKQRLVELLQGLRPLRDSLKSGYILFAGNAIMPSRGEPDVVAKDVATLPGVVSALDETVYFGMTRRNDSFGNEIVVHQAVLDCTRFIGFHATVPAKGQATLMFQVGLKLPECSPEEIAVAVGEDPWKQARSMYPREVNATIGSIKLASNLRSAVMFDRDAYEIILKAARLRITDPVQQGVSVGGLNLVLPYLHGVPPDRLLDLREQLPDAFLDFRSTIASIMARAPSESGDSPDEWARQEADKLLRPGVHKLEKEMEAIAKRTRILGVGLPVVAGVALLTGSFLGMGATAAVGLVATGAAAYVKAKADEAQVVTEAEANPHYFLWRARKGS